MRKISVLLFALLMITGTGCAHVTPIARELTQCMVKCSGEVLLRHTSGVCNDGN